MHPRSLISTLLLPAFSVEDTLGALSIGALVSLFLFGAITLQVYMYLIHFQNDNRNLKMLVGFVWTCELAHCIAVAHLLYYVTISRYGDLTVLLHPPKSLGVAVFLGGLETWVIKIYFAERVRIMGDGRLLIPLVCWLLTSVFFAMIVVTTVKVFQMSTLSAFQEQWNWLVTAVLCIAAAVEIIIASSMCYYLNIWKKELIASSTITILRDIMTWAIETGIVTSVSALTMAACFVIMPRNFIWLAIFVCLLRTVSNALLLSLISRLKSRTSDGFIELDDINRGAKSPATSELSKRNSVVIV
ncbi:hypothetical protein BJ912DRAFT_410398 [Pholiota molesta]|nr:hypothetical protein BJ912DRAFT_410398 [Pholiota molesta]